MLTQPSDFPGFSVGIASTVSIKSIQSLVSEGELC